MTMKGTVQICSGPVKDTQNIVTLILEHDRADLFILTI